MTALVLALALIVAACGSGDDDEASPGAKGGANTTAAPAGGKVNNDPTAFLVQVGTNTPISLDPIRSISSCDIAYLQTIYDTLVRVDAKTGDLEPGLAEKWSSPDPNTFELKLRSGVKFQDGTPFNAAAVKAHLDRAMTDPQSTLVGDLTGIEKVEAPDATTVRITMSVPRSGVLAALFAQRPGMVPSPAAVQAAGGKYGVESAVGAGPYKVTQVTPKEHLKVERWDGYWQNAVQLLGGIEFKGRAAEFQIDRIKNGELNYANLKDTDLPIAQQNESAVNYKLTPSTQFGEIFINWSKAPFNDKRVRQALEYSIDRKLLADQIGQGAMKPAYGPIAPDSWAKSDDVKDLYPFDTAKAKKLLADAGYPNGLTVKVAALDGTYYQTIAQAVKDMVKPAGFNFDLYTISGQESNNLIYVKKSVDVAITAFLGFDDPGLTLEAKYGSKGNSNPSGTTVAGLDELLEKGAAAVSRDERAKAYKAAELLVMKEALAIPTYHNGALVAYAKNVKNVVRGYTTCATGNFLSPPVYIEKG